MGDCLSIELLKSISENPIPVLSRGARGMERIRSREKRIKEWRDIAESITSQLRDVPISNSGGNGNRIERAVVSIVSLQEEIAEEIAEIVKCEQETEEIIKWLVEDEDHKALLEHRYLERKDWETVAEEMGYSTRWALSLHRRAIQKMKMAADERIAILSDQ